MNLGQTWKPVVTQYIKQAFQAWLCLEEWEKRKWKASPVQREYFPILLLTQTDLHFKEQRDKKKDKKNKTFLATLPFLEFLLPWMSSFLFLVLHLLVKAKIFMKISQDTQPTVTS